MRRLSDDSLLKQSTRFSNFLKFICATSSDVARDGSGLIGQAILELGRTGKEDETHKKEDQDA